MRSASSQTPARGSLDNFESKRLELTWHAAGKLQAKLSEKLVIDQTSIITHIRVVRFPYHDMFRRQLLVAATSAKVDAITTSLI